MDSLTVSPTLKVLIALSSEPRAVDSQALVQACIVLWRRACLTAASSRWSAGSLVASSAAPWARVSALSFSGISRWPGIQTTVTRETRRSASQIGRDTQLHTENVCGLTSQTKRALSATDPHGIELPAIEDHVRRLVTP